MSSLLDSILSQTSWGAVEEELQVRKDLLLRQIVYDNLSYENYLRLSGEVKGIDFVLKLKSRRLSSV
ncbi:hypothetical protein UFOVP929_32 [uncultured Caudovirales phage]|uniref:Uncharacterized protein n=1 Tax=uncultured Caudovirales phage TaxID=2100421 RepID=A0A6J5PJH8_9CAUD|nr:hypothetical protein UFOVP929_32 [uncultured Caudovirales phage]